MPEAGFVVRDGGRWWSTPVPGSTPVPVAFDEVVARVASSPARAPAPPAGALEGADRVAPVWAWVGRVVDGGVVVEGNDGESLVLDGDDLALLDALEDAVSVDDLADRSGVADAAVRLARLVGAGRVRRLAPAEEWPPAAAADRGEAPARPRPVHPVRPAGPPAAAGRVPVHAVWQERVGPVLSLGMLTASARHWDGGALNEHYDIRRPETTGQFLAAVAGTAGPAVLLCSNYVWSLAHNLEVARRAKAVCPELVVVHGGPSTPKYEGDAERFLAEHGDVADVLVRGEGELTLCRVLEALAPGWPRVDLGCLSAIEGLTFRVDGRVVRTGEPVRVADLDSLPSPYLTGEFDHIDPAAWHFAVSVETNRGCPYGCTFCDWGSATLSRLRKFGIERVIDELGWVAERGVAAVQLCDANFGILARDVEIARGLAAVSRRHGAPRIVAFTPPKNTTRHVTAILDEVLGAGCLVSTAISLQTVDEATLDAVERSNISTDHYLELAADLRRRGLPLTGDLLIGLPGQTYDSYKADLQFFLDHQISPRSWSLRALPNAPMNAPEYRERHRIRTDADQIVIETATMSVVDRARMLALRKAQVVADQYGVLSHVMRFLQWDHGVAMTDLLDRMLDVTEATPTRFPLLTWMLGYFDLHATAPVGWRSFYEEVGRLVAEDFGVAVEGALGTVLAVQVALMPAPERRFPLVVTLDHDYVAYYREATAGLYGDGRASRPPRPLDAHPPARFEVTGDPLGLCAAGLRFGGDSRDEAMLGQFWIGVGSSHELLSALNRVAPAARDLDTAAGRAGVRPTAVADDGSGAGAGVAWPARRPARAPLDAGRR